MNPKPTNPPTPSPKAALCAPSHATRSAMGEGRGDGRTSSRAAFASLLFTLLLALGCSPKSPQSAAPPAGPRANQQPPAQAPISNTDPCATRLHDLCAPLLLYYGQNQSLPQRLDDLRQVPGFGEQVALTCPVTNQPYVYNPVGIVNPSQPERVIIYDPTPAHSGFRWAISIIEPQGNAPLITKVVALHESQFHLNLPR